MYKIKTHFLSLIFLICSTALYAATAAATAAPADLAQVQTMSLASAAQQLATIQERNALSAQNLGVLQDEYQQQLKTLKSNQVQVQQVLGAELERANAQAKLNDVQLAILESQRTIAAINSNIRNLNDNLRDLSLLASGSRADAKEMLKNYHAKIAFEKALLQIEMHRAAALQDSKHLAQQYVDLTIEWATGLKQLKQQGQFLAKQAAINTTLMALQKQRNAWLAKVSELSSAHGIRTGQEAEFGADRIHYEMSILEANERASVLQTQLILLQVQNRFDELEADEGPTQSIAAYGDANKRLAILMNDLQSIIKVIKGKTVLLAERQTLINQAYTAGVISEQDYKNDSALLTDLHHAYQIEAGQSAAIDEQILVFKARLQTDLSRELARKQGLPGFNLTAWQTLSQQITTLPRIIYQGFANLAVQVVYNVQGLSAWNLALFVFVILGWLAIWRVLRHYLRLAISQVRQSSRRLTTNVLFIILELLRRNILGLVCAAITISLLLLLEIPYTSFEPLFLLLVVWFTFKLIIGFSRIFLLETASVVSNHDVNLFRGLKIAFLVGGVLTVCTMLVHQLPVPFEVRDFFNRLFMVFLLAVSVLLLKSWQVVPSLLAPYTHRKRPYVQRLIRLLSFLIPLTLLATSLIGLSGYVDFAWAINRHIGIFLLIFAGYILVRGFLIDTADWTSELFIQHVRSGWMWSQAILKPLEMVLKLALFLFAIICLFWVYGWDKNSLVIQDLHAFFYLPLFHLAGSLITPLSIIKFIVVLCIFWWAVRWSREFSYRVLFASTKDVGVRNSLAVFMQYTMVVIGFFVILWVLGISVIALAAVLTLFGVGIAFGLRDLFKNYVSGFFLLMERPVKKGDYVTINGNEGQVGHIGLRSFTVVTGDHMELLVPNSEIFDKPFTNWTSQDNIVRTVISIKINRVDDPHAVCDMIMDILTQSPDIVAEPCSQVLLKDIGDALIELEVRYHINLEKTNSRALVRSDLLFKIWDRFKELGIKPPHPQHDIYIKSVPEGTELK